MEKMRRFSTEKKKKQLNQQGKSIAAVKVELGNVKKCANDAMSQIEEIA